MAHCLSQEQVLDIRARLFGNQGRVTVASVRDALRVVGQDELSDDEIVRLVGVDAMTPTPRGSFADSHGVKSSAATATRANNSQKKDTKRRSRKSSAAKQQHQQQRYSAGMSYFVSPNSDSDASSDSDGLAATIPPVSGATPLPAQKLDDHFIFPSVVDFPQFLQRLNRLVQDRETVKELKQLFIVMARFAFERRQKDAASATTSTGAAGGDRVRRSDSVIVVGDSQDARGASAGKSQQQQQQMQRKGDVGGVTSLGLSSTSATEEAVCLSATSDDKELERFLQIRSNVDADKPDGVVDNGADKFVPLNASTSSVSRSFGMGRSTSSSGSFYFSGHEMQLLNRADVMTREELRLVLAEVLEGTVRKSTGIDHVMAGLHDGENVVTSDRFVELILRGGPEVVSLPFLL